MDGFKKMTIGPYVLNQTLGKGQTGIVRLGIHYTTREKVAVKIIDRTKLNPQILSKVEREIAIMKLIEHPHVLRLFDVYENRTHLFLILEYVGGGELFEYLVKKGKLSIKEARRFFSQIMSAVDFCHKHCVCHRDLKPENLLLDENLNIKVADFGMASLQVEGHPLLETSCGSPHYACPEVVKGIRYDGKKADIWSCGVILYALVVGVLPFDDDNLRHLLEKVKKGVFRIPSNVHSDCQELIKRMIEVDPLKRITMKQIMNHNFLKSHVEILEESPVHAIVNTEDITSSDHIDPDVLSCMTCLGCFHDKERLIEKLLSNEQNMEKVLYFLLLERKERRPCNEDVVPKAIKQLIDSNLTDPPRKRVDSCGSPRLNRSLDSNGIRPQSRPRAGTDIGLLKKTSSTPLKSSTPPGSPWWSKIPGMKKTSPRQSPVLARKILHLSNPTLESSPNEIKRSWFAHLPLSGNNHSNYKDEPFFIVIKEKAMSTIKADIVHAFLEIPHLTHNVTSSTTFTAEYSKNKGSSVFRKIVRFDVAIVESSDKSHNDHHNFTVNIKLISGSSNKFKRLCEKIQEILLSNVRVSSPVKRQHGGFTNNDRVPTDKSTNNVEEQRPECCGQSVSMTSTGSEAKLLAASVK